jgi:hypothetical protein
MALKLATTQEIATGMFLRVFCYGLPGSGKTHLAGTFPAPLFVTPEKIMAELRTYGNFPFTVVHFRTIAEFVDAINDIHRLLLNGKPVGGYVPQTIIIDSVTEIQNLIQHELLMERAGSRNIGNQVAGIPVMQDRDWGAMYQVLMQTRNLLYELPAHVVWIGHAKVRDISDRGADGKVTKHSIGTYNLRGDAKHFIPNSCNILTYLEAIPQGPNKTLYCVHGKPSGIWNARVHFPQGVEGFRRLTSEGSTPDDLHPAYDDLAPYFGLPLRDECEEGIDWDQKPESQKKPRQRKQPKRKGK